MKTERILIYLAKMDSIFFIYKHWQKEKIVPMLGYKENINKFQGINIIWMIISKNPVLFYKMEYVWNLNKWLNYP